MNNGGFAFYVHWPFCQSKCPYCDFNSHVSKTIDHEKWCAAYLEEIEKLKDYRTGEELTSIYFGGGTPSTAEPATIAAIIERIGKYWQIDNAEITLEANPTSVEADKFQAFSHGGVNRISMGFQAFNNADLKRLGRLHSVEESLQALDIANKYFDRTNFDLIYARQDQSLDAWQKELNEALKYAPDHLSLYQLTVEDGTAFADLYKHGKLRGLPTDDLAADIYDWTSEAMQARGYDHYEVSNFARAGEQSRHNLVYWRYGDYLGIGPGAHGRIWQDGQRIATTQTRNPNGWLLSKRNEPSTTLENYEVIEEYLMMSLRITEGASFDRLTALGYDLPHQKLADLSKSNHIWVSNSHFGATPQGRLVLNAILRELLI